MRVGPAHDILGLRLNVWTSLLLFTHLPHPAPSAFRDRRCTDDRRAEDCEFRQ